METVPPMDVNENMKKDQNAEYFKALEDWMNCCLLSGLPMPNIALALPPLMNFGLPPAPGLLFALNFPPLPAGNLVRPPTFNTPIPPQVFGEIVEYKIPPLWKRFFAELIDFFILCFLKLAITFIAVDFFDFIDFNNMAVLQSDQKMDYKVALEMTSEFLILELIHRVIVCFYEALALTQPVGDIPGSATPGKSLMKLRVISCAAVNPSANPNTALVTSPATMTVPFAFARSVLKNIILAFLFPICFPFFFGKFNRAGYDVMCRCIVVEDPVQPIRRR